MPIPTEQEILAVVARFYMESDDFNGVPLGQLFDRLNSSWEQIGEQLKSMVSSGKLGILTGDWGNSHIIGVGFPEIQIQLSALDKCEPYHTCIYLRPPHLAMFVSDDLYRDEPYTRHLALGEGQLSFRVFDLAVLEYYRNDPRYQYNNDDSGGRICVRDEYYQSTEMAESDQVLLETFGFAYDDDMNRGVAVFLRYLSDLSPEHQQIWRAKEVNGTYKLHPDYYESAIRGSWDSKVSVCDALIAEVHVINLMAAAMGREPLFREDFGMYGERKPREFCFLIRPTCKEFNSFINLLDKILSENINPKFFGGDVSFENEITRADGKIQVERKGTLRVFDEWIRKRFRTNDWTYWNESYKTLKEIRKLRQKPAHTLDDNRFDQKYFKEQREILVRAYAATRCIRLLLQNHPLVKTANVEIPEYLNGQINTQ